MFRRFRPMSVRCSLSLPPLLSIAKFQNFRYVAITVDSFTNLDTFLQTNVCNDFLLDTKVRITSKCDKDLLALLAPDRDPSTWKLSRLQDEIRNNSSHVVPNSSLLRKIRHSSENAIIIDCAKFLEKVGATTVETFIEKFPQRNTSAFDALLQTVLFPKLQKAFFNLITKESSSTLVCGTCNAYLHHHRQSEMNRLRNVVREKFLKKEDKLPLILVSSCDRGGKSLFLDSVANDRELFQSNQPTFAFNINFSLKHLEKNRRLHSLRNCAEQDGLCEILVRLAESALNFQNEKKLMKIIRFLFCNVTNMSFGRFVQLLQERIVQVHCQDNLIPMTPETCNWILCFDDFSNFLGSFSYSTSQKIPQLDAKIEKRSNLIKRKMINAVSGLIRHNAICVASGSGFQSPRLLDKIYHRHRGKKSFLRIPEFYYLPLGDPITDALRRRDSHVLKTIYFSRVHLFVRPDFALAIFYYEMIKSSPHLMLKMFKGFHPAKKSFDEVLCDAHIYPKSKTGLTSILTMMQLKSVQFCKAVPSRFIEPFFIASEIMSESQEATSLNHLLVRYTKMLQQYSHHFLDFRCYETAASAMRHFVDVPIENRTSKETVPVFIESRTHLTNIFFDSAVAIGICIQKSLRRDWLQKNNDNCCSFVSVSVDDFLLQKRSDDDNDLNRSECVFSSIPLPSSVPRMFWTRSTSCEASPKIMNFRGHYPLARTAQVYDPLVRSPNILKSDSPIGNYFNTATVLCAELSDKHYGNPLVDIIFHQKADHDAEGSPSLIQFWIDTKHRHSRQESFLGNTFSTFVSRVAQALDNPLLLSQCSNSKVNHIVHIIVTPHTITRTGSHTTADIRKQFFNTSDEILKKTIKNKISYSLYFVSPDSLGFENLVSHYVARTIPLQDQQMRESWSNRVKSPREWETYKATSSLNLEHNLTKSAQDQKIPLSAAFDEWCNLRIRDECVSLAFSVLQLGQVVDGSFTFLKQIQSIDFVRNLSKSVTFGDVLERLQIIHPHGNASCILDDCFSIHEKIEKNSHDDVGQFVAAIRSIDKFRFHFLEAGLCIGMMLNHQSVNDEKNGERNFFWWNFFFEPSFIAAWNQEARNLFDKGEIDHEWVSRCSRNNNNNNNNNRIQNKNKINSFFDMTNPFYGSATVAATVWDMKLWRWGKLRARSPLLRPYLKRSRPDHDGLTIALQTSQCVYILESIAKKGEWQSVRDFMATIDEKLYLFKKYSFVSGQ